MEYRWTSVLIFVLISCSFTKQQVCEFPTDLKQSTWVATGGNAVGNFKFRTTTLSGYDIMIQGTDYGDHTCVKHIAANGIYVFRTDGEFYDASTGTNKRAYSCFRLKKITDNLYTFYILGDNQNGGYRYNSFTDEDLPSEICTFCSVSDPPEDSQYSLLRREGTNDQVPDASTIKFCPCETTTDVCYPAIPPTGTTPKRCKHR